jgi:hypothetical protein
MGFTKRNQKTITEQKKILFLTKQNKTKFAVFIVSQNKRNFAKQFFVLLCFVFCKKGCKMETLIRIQ